MSGGYFDYQEHRMEDIAQQLDSDLPTLRQVYGDEFRRLVERVMDDLRAMHALVHALDYHLEGDDEKTFVEMARARYGSA